MLNDELDDHKWLEPDDLGGLKITGGLGEVIGSALHLLGPT
jgi:8-oxo-dGTP diphosphatase